jgi:hypothetical protein
VLRLCWPRTIVGLRHLAICMFPAKIPIIESPTIIEPIQVGSVLKSKVCRTRALSDHYGDTKGAVFKEGTSLPQADNLSRHEACLAVMHERLIAHCYVSCAPQFQTAACKSDLQNTQRICRTDVILVRHDHRYALVLRGFHNLSCPSWRPSDLQ